MNLRILMDILKWNGIFEMEWMERMVEWMDPGMESGRGANELFLSV